VTLKLAETSVVKSRLSVPYGANFLILRTVVLQIFSFGGFVWLLYTYNVLLL